MIPRLDGAMTVFPHYIELLLVCFYHPFLFLSLFQAYYTLHNGQFRCLASYIAIFFGPFCCNFVVILVVIMVDFTTI